MAEASKREDKEDEQGRGLRRIGSSHLWKSHIKIDLTRVPTYEITEHWGVFVGFGAEFKKNENFFVFKGWIGYLVFRTGRWSTEFIGYYESKGGEFGAWGVGIGVFRHF